ncbi:hypothetical protein [Mesorhizobium sp. ANAO-SY3R2]|uniref:hypothetical protein n=1 Tax=Mesorhizobium sp. ANAO-SY3R2 TaxID=3166644 RepID=UPI00366B8989
MEFLTLFFSAMSAVAAGTAAWIAWVVYRKQVTADLPVVSIAITPTDVADWYEVTIEVANRSDVEWQAEEAVVTAPNGAKLISSFDVAREPDRYGNPGAHVINLIDPLRISSKAKPRIKVLPAGASGGNSMIIGSRDRHSETLFLFLPSAASRSVSIRYSLASTEAAQRRSDIEISRALTAHPAMATA